MPTASACSDNQPQTSESLWSHFLEAQIVVGDELFCAFEVVQRPDELTSVFHELRRSGRLACTNHPPMCARSH